ncbi:peroxisomal membrane protein 11A [Tanacetum coccineum]
MEPNPSLPPTKQNPNPNTPKPNNNRRDFLTHLESYLSKRDGVDKLLKITRYATKIILSSNTITISKHPLIHTRLKTFETNVGISRKAFRIGKFIQNVNSLRSLNPETKQDLIMALIAYSCEGVYYFVEQFVWLVKSGLLDKKYGYKLQLISAWAELFGYFGSVWLKVKELDRIKRDEECLVSSIEITSLRGEGDGEGVEVEKLRKLREKKMLKKLSVVQDVADGLMAVADVRDGKGALSAPLLLACAGMVSAVISTHKNWLSC